MSNFGYSVIEPRLCILAPYYQPRIEREKGQACMLLKTYYNYAQMDLHKYIIEMESKQTKSIEK